MNTEKFQRPLEDLLKEVTQGEIELLASAEGVLRKVDVARLMIKDNNGRFLVERKQILPNRKERRRNIAPSEKIFPGESLDSAVRRALSEELGSVLPSGAEKKASVDTDNAKTSVKVTGSKSYGNIKTEYTFHTVLVRVGGLPDKGFETVEETPRGPINAVWDWVNYPPHIK